MESNRYKTTLFVLMITVVFDFMGFLLVFPLLPGLLISKYSLLLPSDISQWTRYICYSMALASWPLGNFFGTAFLGMASDQYGRKWILMFGLFVVSVTYFLQAMSITMHSAFLFIVARTVQGFFGGNYDVAQAAIADISLPEQKTRNMGLIALASSIGIVFGPAISALTTSSHYFSWFTITTPFWIATILSFCNVVWIGFVFNETFHPIKDQSIRLSKMFTAFSFMLTDHRVVKISIVFFFLMLAWGFYVQQIPIVMQKIFYFSPHTLGLFFEVLGVGLVFAMLYLHPTLTKRYAPKQLYVYFMIVVAATILVASILLLLPMEWLSVFIIATCHVSAYGCLLAILSNSVGHEEQGKTMGGAGAINCLAFMMAAIINAFLSMHNILIPLFMAAGSYLLSGFILKKTGFEEQWNRKPG